MQRVTDSVFGTHLAFQRGDAKGVDDEESLQRSSDARIFETIGRGARDRRQTLGFIHGLVDDGCAFDGGACEGSIGSSRRDTIHGGATKEARRQKGSSREGV